MKTYQGIKASIFKLTDGLGEGRLAPKLKKKFKNLTPGATKNY